MIETLSPSSDAQALRYKMDFKEIIHNLIPEPGHFLVFDPAKETQAPSKQIVKKVLNIIENPELAKKVFRVYARAHNNACSLLEEAELLLENGFYSRAVMLAIMSFEEIGKSQIAADYYSGVLSENEYQRSFKVHKKTSFASRMAVIGGESPNIKNGYWVNDDIAIEFENIRQKSVYVDEENDPLQAFSKSDAELIIRKVRAHIEYIIYAEEFNNRIGSRALFK
jgi:AbiV family abortive infection protein